MWFGLPSALMSILFPTNIFGTKANASLLNSGNHFLIAFSNEFVSITENIIRKTSVPS